MQVIDNQKREGGGPMIRHIRCCITLTCPQINDAQTKETAFSLFSGDGPVYILGTTMVVEDQLGAFDDSLDEEIDSDEYVPSIQSLIQCVLVHPSTCLLLRKKENDRYYAATERQEHRRRQ